MRFEYIKERVQKEGEKELKHRPRRKRKQAKAAAKAAIKRAEYDDRRIQAEGLEDRNSAVYKRARDLEHVVRGSRLLLGVVAIDGQGNTGSVLGEIKENWDTRYEDSKKVLTVTGYSDSQEIFSHSEETYTYKRKYDASVIKEFSDHTLLKNKLADRNIAVVQSTIESLEDTITMFELAAADPELNPDCAEAVRVMLDRRQAAEVY